MRRDFTINSIYWDPATQSVEDPLDGVTDLRAGILRHTGPAFSEDPLRVLRAFQFCARFNFSVAPETVQLVHPTLQGEFVFFVSRGFACGSGYLRNISCI